MSILSEQLIGGALWQNKTYETVGGGAARDAFHSMLTDDEWAARPYFKGFTYAADSTQADMFFAEAPSQRTGPRAGTLINNGSNDWSYGPIGRKMGTEGTTMLGILASMMEQGADHTEGDRTWNTSGPGRTMATTFASGDQMRSLWNSQLGADNNPMASGGAFTGYQRSNQYAINNWDAVNFGVAGTAAETRAMSRGEAQQTAVFGTDKYNESTGMFIITPEVAGVAASSVQEVVAPSTAITTGIRGLPGMMEVGFVPPEPPAPDGPGGDDE